jgi:hypothetical protein
MAVAHDAVGRLAELPESGEDGGRLAERKKTGNIGKSQRGRAHALFDDEGILEIPEHDARQAVTAIAREREVHPGDESQRLLGR